MVTFMLFLSAVILLITGFVVLGIHYDGDTAKDNPLKESWALPFGIICIIFSINSFCVSGYRMFTSDTPTRTEVQVQQPAQNLPATNMAALNFKEIITQVDTDGVWIGPNIKIMDYTKNPRDGSFLAVGDTILLK